MRRAVEDAGVVDQHVDFAQRGDEFRDAGEIGEVVDDVARFLVQREDAEAALLEERGCRFADALRGAGDEDGLQARPGMLKPAPLRSRINSSSWFEVSSTSGGRQVLHCGSLPKCATALFSAGIIGCFCTILRVAVMPACSWSASAERQFL